MVAVLGIYGPHDGGLVGVRGGQGQGLAEFGPRLTIFDERAWALEQGASDFFIFGHLGGRGLAVEVASIGSGSSRFTWLGPPCMKSWITDFAWAGGCGGFGRVS